MDVQETCLNYNEIKVANGMFSVLEEDFQFNEKERAEAYLLCLRILDLLDASEI